MGRKRRFSKILLFAAMISTIGTGVLGSVPLPVKAAEEEETYTVRFEAYEGTCETESVSVPKYHAALCDGYTAVFEWDGEHAVNVSPGCSWYEMKKQEDGWVIRDLKNHRKHHYNSRGLLEAVEDRNGQKTL